MNVAPVNHSGWYRTKHEGMSHYYNRVTQTQYESLCREEFYSADTLLTTGEDSDRCYTCGRILNLDKENTAKVSHGT